MSHNNAPVSFPSLTPTLLRRIGEALGGRHWQADIARQADVSKGQITRFLISKGGKGRRVPTEDFALQLDRIILDKIEDVANFIGSPSSPLASGTHEKAKRKILEGVAMLREFTPRVRRPSIKATSIRTEKPGPEPKDTSNWTRKIT